MRRISSLRSWLRVLIHKRSAEQQLQKELQFHLEQQEAENVSAGMTEEEARYAALRVIGNIGSIQEQCRDTWRSRWLESAMQDASHALRMLRQSPGFTAVAVTI